MFDTSNFPTSSAGGNSYDLFQQGEASLGYQETNPLSEINFNENTSLTFRYNYLSTITNWDYATVNLDLGGYGIDSQQVLVAYQGTPVPEPTTITLLGIGLISMAGAEVIRRRKKKAVDNN